MATPLATDETISWACFPPEIRLTILENLLQDGCTVALFATVSREWQAVIERHNFARIKLTPSRLVDLNRMVHRNRSHVRYLWLCLELEEYDCTACGIQPEFYNLHVSDADNILIATAFQNLFSALSTWEPNNNTLMLDISVYSLSDTEHAFKYLTFEPDSGTPWARNRMNIKVGVPVRDGQHDHGRTLLDPWTAAMRPGFVPSMHEVLKIFGRITLQQLIENRNQRGARSPWWQQLPPVPAVTAVLLRQQTRRVWNPCTLVDMFARLPGLQEIHYEPWREWFIPWQRATDTCYLDLFESLAGGNLKRLVLFENFNEHYVSGFTGPCAPIRTASPAVSQMVASASLQLESLSASFMVDACDFFKSREPSWEWPNLTSLVLTSRLLTPDESTIKIGDLLQAAAAAAMKMPKLETMEIWNGRKGLAALFRYQSIGGGRPAVVTWKGTWDFALEPPVIRAWEAVALSHRGFGLTIVKELLHPSVIETHGDSIHCLKHSTPVIRPVSLHQIRMEHKISRGVGPDGS